jgi:hypothetical protein
MQIWVAYDHTVHYLVDLDEKEVVKVEIPGWMNTFESPGAVWNDPAYATRICVSQIVGEQWNNELGYGLTLNSLCDNEHSVPVVDFDKWAVTLYDRDLSTVKFTMGLDAFVKHFSKHNSLV